MLNALLLAVALVGAMSVPKQAAAMDSGSGAKWSEFGIGAAAAFGATELVNRSAKMFTSTESGRRIWTTVGNVALLSAYATLLGSDKSFREGAAGAGAIAGFYLNVQLWQF